MIVIPSRFKELLNKKSTLSGTVDIAIEDFGMWFHDNKLEFFPEYTDHGINHINNVLDSAESIITDNSWKHITPEDIFVLILSVLLHDCAMHLNADNFIHLINNEKYPQKKSRFVQNDTPWKILWEEFMAEALRWDAKKLNAIFNDKTPLKRFEISDSEKLLLTTKDKMLIGEFLRRNHSRLGHEIALNGVPISNSETISINFDNEKLLDIAGLIARSHNYELRDAVDLLPKNQKKQYLECHIPFIMGILRIADYIQIQSARAPKQLLKIKKLVSPISRAEVYKHISIEEIHTNDDDPEALFVQVEPDSVKTFILLKELFSNIQEEIDAFWALIGEVYGLAKNLNVFGIEIRRIKSNIDNIKTFIEENNPAFVPEKLSFKSAEAEMLNLLVKPLYGDKPEVGIRELLQNAIDACRERYNYLLNHNKTLAEEYKNLAAVKISIDRFENDKYILIIEDNGIGMSLHVLKNYFLNIGASFRNSDSWKKENTDENGKSKIYRTGRFGVGVLAAYLLSDEIEVSTQYINDTEGYTFLCKVEDEFITMSKKIQNIGTKVSIIIEKDTYDKLLKDNYGDSNYARWDWFCLQWPLVERSLNGKILKQEFNIINANEKTPKGYHRIESPEYNDVLWSYALEKNTRWYNRKFEGLICNGIKVKDNLYGLELKISNSPTIIVETPALIIFDQDGLLPLNLQRDDLVTNQLTFIEVLMESISIDFVNTLVETLQKIEKTSLMAYFTKNKANFFIKDKWDNISFFPQLIICNYKYLPFDAYLLEQAKPKNILLEPINNADNSSLWEIFKNDVDSFIPVLNPKNTISSRVEYIRTIFHEDKTELPINGKILIIRLSEIIELEGKSGFPKSILKGKEKTVIDSEWVMYSTYNIKLPDIDPVKVVEIMKNNTLYAIGIWNLKWSDTAKQNISPFAKTWIDKVGTPAFNPK